MLYIIDLYEISEPFRILTHNSGLSTSQLNSFSEELAKCGDFCVQTLKFLFLLAKNKRFVYLHEIALKYKRSYLLLTKEEKITIICAYELSESEKEQVKTALNQNPENHGKKFIIEYKLNPAIIGGLQIYTEDKFMDLSLSSRIDRLKDEVNKLI